MQEQFNYSLVGSVLLFKFIPLFFIKVFF